MRNTKKNKKRELMSAWSTMFAMLKAFTTINLFTLPIYFKFGGYLFAPASLIFCCVCDCGKLDLVRKSDILLCNAFFLYLAALCINRDAAG